jgi:ribosomal protein S27E
MAVCSYCNGTLLKEADAVRDIGKMGQVLEDYSRLQIPASGNIDGSRFTVVGRIQLRYDDGFWNEWYVLFDDSSAGWLSDASGQYVFTREVPANPRAMGFGLFKPGKPFISDGKTFYASDVRTAQCTAGEGELPFQVGAGYTAKVVDLRAGNAFMTLDYSDGDSPRQYLGRGVTLEEMQCQLLRDDDAIKEKAGNYRGKVQPLACPSCGHGISYAPGFAAQLVCPSCHTPIDASTGGKAEVLLAVDTQEQHKPTLPLGDIGTLDGVSWQVLGVLARVSEGEAWGEYLLFNPVAGFLWLIELADGSWQKCHVLNVWPDWKETSLRYQNSGYALLYRYEATVAYAAGAFNWRVKAGDTDHVKEYGSGQSRLSMEWSDTEINWSASEPLPQDVLQKAFGSLNSGWLGAFGRVVATKPAATATRPAHAAHAGSDDVVVPSLKPVAYFFSAVLFLLNASYLDGMGFILFLVAMAFIWVPVFFTDAVRT